MMTIIALTQSVQISQLEMILLSKQLQKQQAQDNFVRLRKKLVIIKKPESVENIIEKKRKQLTGYQLIINQLTHTIKKPEVSYSQVLMQLSESNIDNIWLTKINIEQDHLSLFTSILLALFPSIL